MESVPLFAWAFLFGTIIVIALAIVAALTRAAATRAALEIELRIIDKLDSPEAVAKYLSAANERPLTGALSARAQTDRVLEAVQIAIVVGALGVGIVVTGMFIPNPPERMDMFGMLAIALAIGFAAVAYVTRRLVKQWTSESSPRST
jgi:hypothetical protein